MAKRNWRGKKKKPKPKGNQADSLEVTPESKGKGKEKGKDKHPTTPGWRKGFGVRADVPAITVSDEVSSETAFDPDSSRRSSMPGMPKLVRYFSGFHPSSKSHLDHIDFNVPWWEETENELVPKPAPVDPHVALQSAFSHMVKVPSTPLPVSHFSGMFSLFEEYKKLRLGKEELADKFTKLTEETAEWQSEWDEAEVRYQSEIRRLELHIAHGTTGMEGLAVARMGSVVKRQKVIGVRPGSEGFQTTSTAAPGNEKLGEGSQRMPASDQMAAMSQGFSAVDDMHDMHNMPFGTLPTRDPGPLAQKLKSELNMAKMMAGMRVDSSSRSVESESTWAGDPLPDEVEARNRIIDNVDALPALRDLADVVAQQRGIDSKRFTSGLMQLLMEKAVDDKCSISEDTDSSSSEDEADTEEASSHGSAHAGSRRTCRRRFSFELGDDTPPRGVPTVSSREGSRAALSMDERRHSGSSVLTAFRNNSAGSVQAMGGYERPKPEHGSPGSG